MILIALAVGLVIGLLLGMLGGGGSILAVPALVYLLDQDLSSAVPTSLLVVGLASLAGMAEHARAGDVRWRTGVGFAAPGVATSFAGAWLNSRLPEDALLLAFAALMVAVAARMLVAQDRGAGSRRLEGGARRAGAVGAGAGVGFLTGLLGVGGGFLVVPALALVLGLPMAVAVGTSLLVVVVNSGAGFVANVGGAAIDVGLAATFVAGALVAAVPGARLASRVDEDRLRRLFAALIVVVAVAIVVQVGAFGGVPS